MSKPLSPIVTFEEEPVTIPRLVQVAVEIMDAPNIDMAEQTWRGLISIYTEWDPTPSSPNERFFRPWIQFDNVKSAEQIKNPATIELTDDELIAKVGQRVTSVFEVRFFTAVFNFRMLPDNNFQVLCVSIVSDLTSRTTFTHVTGPRDSRTKALLPGFDGLDDDDDEPIAKTSCTLGNSLLRRRCVIADDGNTLNKTKEVVKESMIMDIAASFKTVAKEKASRTPAIKYVFSQNKTMIKHDQVNIQRLDVQWGVMGVSQSQKLSMMFSVVLPLAGLTAFSFDDKGEQLSILFTLILTSVAQGFAGGGKSVMLSKAGELVFLISRAFLFAIVVVVAVNPAFIFFTFLYDTPPDYTDIWYNNLLAVLLCYIAILLYFLRILKKEEMNSAAAQQLFAVKAKQSHENEERRLRHLWFPSQAQAEKELAKQKEAAAAAKRPSSRFSHRFSRRKEAAKIEDLTPTA